MRYARNAAFSTVTTFIRNLKVITALHLANLEKIIASIYKRSAYKNSSTVIKSAIFYIFLKVPMGSKARFQTLQNPFYFW